MRLEFAESEIKGILFVVFACFMSMIFARACKVEKEHTYRMRQLELIKESSAEVDRR